MKLLVWLLVAILMPIPWMVLKLTGQQDHLLETNPQLVSIISGLAIIGAAFVLSWGAELSERDIPRSLALIALALISVLPEYAVDMNFAWHAGKNPVYRAYAVANMTGANRLLIGIGWPLIALIFYFRFHRKDVPLDRSQNLELSMLVLATVYSFIFPIKGTLSLLDMVIFFAIFLYYAARAMRGERHDEAQEGIAGWLDQNLGDSGRRLVVIMMFAFAGYAIWLAANPFAEGLVHTGKRFGLNEFLLVQWVAPVASESPEVIIAILFALKGMGSTGIGALVSSKVNQWTLLVGAIPLVYAISAGSPGHMMLDHRQREELLLTSAQSFFAAMVICDLRFSLWEALMLLGLFLGNFFFTHESIRYIFSAIYITAAVALIISSRERRHMFLTAVLLRSKD